MKTSESELPPDPKAVVLARIFLVAFGFASTVVGGAMWIGTIFSPGWWATAAALAVGMGCLISAFLEGPRSVVATFLIFFFPWT